MMAHSMMAVVINIPPTMVPLSAMIATFVLIVRLAANILRVQTQKAAARQSRTKPGNP